jgi:hypothetical protein
VRAGWGGKGQERLDWVAGYVRPCLAAIRHDALLAGRHTARICTGL